MNDALARMYRYRLPFLQGELAGLPERLTLADLRGLDHYHYCGTSAIDHAIERLGITAQSHVLDIGAGVGGTARYLAERVGCQVTGLELQPCLCQMAVELTERTGLADRVRFLQGDVLQGVPGQYDAWLSLLVFLHIPDRHRLFAQCAAVLKPGGRFYIEDYVQLQPLTPRERETLAQMVACPTLPTLEQYQTHLQQAGFAQIAWENVTPLWRDWVQQRYVAFQAQQNHYRQKHGDELVESYLAFYQAVAELFAGGNVGGVRIWGRRNDSEAT
ncbi:MAG: methyltransferase domain-containing protein [Gloeomargarita sp. SKYBB_i_bin120]|nr:methyltransferase domain-containing protein [Gloeomargarita sp. SKYG98]MCS7291597.1 methyltransferase domain-containing protein [Gloeomargarita sp. SKYB120]MDW8177157.1 methyltransferase domain-containing protein [Gloeomargarita sp. SKYBB_i_bin120]